MEANGLQTSDPLDMVLGVAIGSGSVRTQEAMREGWKDFRRALGVVDERAAVAALLRSPAECGAVATRYLEDLKRRGLKSATIQLRLAVLRRIVKVASARGIGSVGAVPLAYRADDAEPRPGPGIEDVRKIKALLLGRASSPDYVSLRDLVLLDLLYHRALRKSEVLGIALGDVVEGGVMIRRKGRHDKGLVALTEESLGLIADAAGLHPFRGDGGAALICAPSKYDGGALSLSGLRRLIEGWCRDAGVGRIRPHGFRHAGVTHLLDKSGGNVALAQRLAGHADPRTTMRYDDARVRRELVASRMLQEDA